MKTILMQIFWHMMHFFYNYDIVKYNFSFIIDKMESCIEEFKNLSLQQQKEKLIAMLSQLKDWEWFFEKVKNSIETSNVITSEDLAWIYQDIIEFAEELRNISKEEKKDLMSKLHSKIESLHKQEEQERLEENPDDLLNQI